MISEMDFTGLDNKIKVPIKLWLKWGESWSYPPELPQTKESAIHHMGVEESAREQILNLARLPFAFHHIAIMPDCHSGYGMPIGGVLATEGVVVPNAVGVDIGCGMCAVKTSLKVDQLDKETLKKIMGKIREVIPVGFDHQKQAQKESDMPDKEIKEYNIPIVAGEYVDALFQLGTLGSGNHFIEIQKDNENNVWIMIHSGSRNLGYKVAKHYNELAYNLNINWFSNTHLPKKKEDSLAFLPLDSREGQNYLAEMQYCIDFALANRKLMMKRIISIFQDIFIKEKVMSGEKIEMSAFVSEINIAHNYARLENHFGSNVMVHRKGATSAKTSELGIIPGSQGTKSYIVKGLGNKDSFESCSHGAGRKMGRNQACKTLNLEEEQKKLDDQGIVHGVRTQKNLDEASGAYKDISEVMANQNDLVEILVELSPMAVIKGD
jgi:tRNA-splicing ligase RtcB